MTIEFTPAGFDAFQNNITNVQTVGIGTTNPLGTLQVGSGTSTFIVTGIGSVGIGTTNPTAKFEVTGDITVSANSGSFRTIGAPNSSNTTLLLQGGAVSGSGGNIELGRDGINYYDANAQVFRNLNASTEYGRFNESGNLLVGTATSTGTASQRLQVTGGAYVSGNLGVGATNPQNPLHISGSAGTLLRLDGDSGGTGTRDIFFSEFNTTAYGGIIRYDSVADLFTFGTVDNSVVINAINVKRVTGDVGIGTTTPTDRLTLHNASGAAGMSALASGNAYLVLDGGRGGTVGNQISFIDFKLNSTIYGNLAVNEGTSGTPFEINSAVSNDVSLVGGGGNVGIASAIPTAALTIGSVGIASDGKSQIYLNGTTSNRIDFNTAGGAAPAIIGTSGTTRSAGTKIVLYPGAGGSQVDYGFGIESSALWSSSGGSFKWYGGTVGIATLSNTGNLSLSGALTIGSNSNIIADYTNATLASRTYFITNTTNGSTFVGAIPNGTSTSSGFLAFNNATPTNGSFCSIVAANTTASLISAQTGTGAYLPLSIQTNNTTQVAISTGGEVTFTKGITVSTGIGTITTISGTNLNYSGIATVGTALSVTGPTKLNTHLAVTGVSTFSGDVLVSGIATVSNGPLIIGAASSTGTASQPLQVTGGAYVSGNLGIGTTNPLGTLQVGSGTSTFIVTGIGSVGIGITNPGAKLDVAGDIRLSAADAEIEFNNGGARLKGRTNALSIHTGGGLNSDASEQVRINTTGVGIGTTNPTVVLQLSPTSSISNVGFGITLAGTVGSALTVAQFVYANANTSYLRIKATRNATGSDWTTTSTKLINVTDTTEQGYIEYNPNGSTYGLAFGSGATEWARFLLNGNLGIGTTNPTSKLHVVGDVLVTGITTSTDFNSSSDINLKDNIQRIENPIDKVLQLDGVTFNWKSNQRPSVGVIAQQVEKVLPQLVSGDYSKTVNYNGLIGLLIECIKEQQNEIDAIKKKLQ